MSELVGLEKARKVLASCVRARKPACLIGETGTGKSTLAREVLEGLCPQGVIRINLNGGTTPDELEGRFQLKGQETYFQEGVLVEAMRQGKGLILDELNAALPDTLFVLHGVLEVPPRLHIPETGADITPHPDFTVVATMNPTHEYAGTRQLNLALYSRFAVVVRFGPLGGTELVKAVQSHHPMATLAVVAPVCDVVEQLMKLRKGEKLTTPIGIREAIAAVGFACDGLTLKEAINAAIAAKLDPTEWPVVREAVKLLAPKVTEKLTTLEQLVGLATRTQEAEKEAESLKKKMAKYDGLMAALKAAGVTTTEDVEELAKRKASDGH